MSSGNVRQDKLRKIDIANSLSPASQQNIRNEPNGRSGGEEGAESGGSDSIHLNQSNAVSDFATKNGDNNEKTHDPLPSMGNSCQRYTELANMPETSRTVSAAWGSGNIQQNTLRKIDIANSSSPASQQNIRNEPKGRSGSEADPNVDPEQAGSDSMHLNGFALENRDNNGTLTAMNNSSQRHMGSAHMLNTSRAVSAALSSGNIQQNRLRQIATSQQNIQNEPNGSEADPNSSNHPNRFKALDFALENRDIDEKIRDPLPFMGNSSADAINVSSKLSAASGGARNSPMFIGKRPSPAPPHQNSWSGSTKDILSSSEPNGWPSGSIYPDHELINVARVRGGHESYQSNAVFRANGDNDGGIQYDPPFKRYKTDSRISMPENTPPTDNSPQHRSENTIKPTAASSDVEQRLQFLSQQIIQNRYGSEAGEKNII